MSGCLMAFCLSGCASGERYAGTYINWESPLLLEDGKIGMFQVMWDEYLSGCGYPFSGNNCSRTRNIRVHFVTFSPADSSLDTLFTPLSARYSEQGGSGLAATYHTPYLLYENHGTNGIYNYASGEHRPFPSGGTFSRTGTFVTSGFLRVSVATGQVDSLTPYPWQIDYYDDIKNKAIVFRWKYTPDGPKNYPRVTSLYGVVYDVATGTFDSSRATTLSQNFSKSSRGSILVTDRVRVNATTMKVPFARVESFDVSAPSFDTVVVVTEGYHLDLDPDARVYVHENYSFRDREAGITFGTFDGTSAVYRARDFHQGIPPAP